MKTKRTGRPRKVVTREMLIEAYDRLQRWDKVAIDLDVSHSTVMRRVAEYNIQRIFVRCE